MSFCIRKDEIIFTSEAGTEIRISHYFDDKIVTEARNPDTMVADNEGMFTAEEMKTLGRIFIAAGEQFNKGGKNDKK